MKINFYLIIGLAFFSCNQEKKRDISPDSLPKNDSLIIKSYNEKCELKNGDILFINSDSRQSVKISLATKSPYTHCGIYWNISGKKIVYEAASSVEKTMLNEFKLQSSNESIVVKRLNRNFDTLKVKQFLEANLGKKYDVMFLWNDQEMYCSELVYKAFLNANMRLCETHQLREYDLKSEAVENELKKRYKNKIPFEETMVAPSDLFQSMILDSICLIK